MLLHVLPNRLVTSNGVVFNRKSIEFHGSSLKSMHGSLPVANESVGNPHPKGSHVIRSWWLAILGRVVDNPIHRLDFPNIFREAFEDFRFGAGNGLLFLRISNVAMDKKGKLKVYFQGVLLEATALKFTLELPSFSGVKSVQLQGWTLMMIKKRCLAKVSTVPNDPSNKNIGPNQKRRRFEGHLAFPNYSLKHTYRTYRTVPVVMELLTHFLAQTK